MDGTVGAVGEKVYQSMRTDVKIIFVFARDNIVIIGTSHGHVFKVFNSQMEKSFVCYNYLIYSLFVLIK
jgi:hypothetical protein